MVQVLLAAQQYKHRTGVYPQNLPQMGGGIGQDPFSGKDLIFTRTVKGTTSARTCMTITALLQRISTPGKGDRVLAWPE